MFIYSIPKFVKKIFPKLIWDIPAEIHQHKYIYFTFDDGPTPEITKFVLDELQKFQAKATFFCIGKNIIENPEIIKQIISQGHSIGNHTMNHLNAWKVSNETYNENIEKCERIIQQYVTSSVGFRPPYGRVSKFIYNNELISNKIMWTVLTGDYRKGNFSQQIIDRCTPYLMPGSIVVFHDSVKSFHNLKVILPAFLSYCQTKHLIPSALPYHD